MGKRKNRYRLVLGILLALVIIGLIMSLYNSSCSCNSGEGYKGAIKVGAGSGVEGQCYASQSECVANCGVCKCGPECKAGQCSDYPDQTCQNGACVCNPGAQCSPGCSGANGTCGPDLKCSNAGACVCANDKACPVGQYCSNDACIPCDENAKCSTNCPNSKCTTGTCSGGVCVGFQCSTAGCSQQASCGQL